MRILVVSDVHDDPRALEQAIAAQPTARNVIFLGDGLRWAEESEKQHPDRVFWTVPGNCDWSARDRLPAREEIFGGRRFFFTHGHAYRVKYGTDLLESAARERGADIVLFGHTHETCEEYRDGLYLFNPGSLGYDGTYGYVDVEPGGLVTRILRLR